MQDPKVMKQTQSEGSSNQFGSIIDQEVDVSGDLYLSKFKSHALDGMLLDRSIWLVHGYGTVGTWVRYGWYMGTVR